MTIINANITPNFVNKSKVSTTFLISALGVFMMNFDSSALWLVAIFLFVGSMIFFMFKGDKRQQLESENLIRVNNFYCYSVGVVAAMALLHLGIGVYRQLK